MALGDGLRALAGGGGAAVVVETVVGTGQFIALFADFILANVELFLPLVSTIANRLAPELEWLPEDLMSKIVLLLAVVYVAVTLGRIVNNWNNDR